jgi:protein-tyrosine phosphatase
MELALIPNQECKSVIDNIIDNIYLGNFQSHKNFNGSIINLSDYDYDYKINDKYKLLRINISDSRDANENIAQYFTKCIEFIETNKYDNILIHCNEGVSRSVTIVLAILIKKYNYDLKSAIEFVKSKRTHPTAPKRHFLKQLLSFTKT